MRTAPSPTNFGNLAVFVHTPTTFALDPFFCGIVAFSVQSFYAYRVFVVSKKAWYLPACIVILSLLSAAFAMGTTARIYAINTEFVRFDEMRWIVTCWLLLAAAADILITGSLMFYLRQASKQSHQRSSSIISRILTVTIETNGLTCIFAVVDAILFLTMPTEAWHVIPNFALVKLYFNGCLVSLNCRKSLSSPSSHHDHHRGHNLDSYALQGTPAQKYAFTSHGTATGSVEGRREPTFASCGGDGGNGGSVERTSNDAGEEEQRDRTSEKIEEGRRAPLRIFTTQEVTTHVSSVEDCELGKQEEQI